METKIVNLNDKFNSFTDYWSPKIDSLFLT